MRLLPFLLAQAVALTWTPSPTPNATTTIYRDGVAIASAVTAAAYTDSAVLAGSTHSYYLTATAPGLATSVPSNTFTAVIPTPAVLTPTLIGVGTRVVNGNLTSVAVTVTANGKPASGTVTWTVAGKVFFTDTLNKRGQDVQNVWTPMLANLPITITYSGTSTYAPSTATVQ